MVRRVAILAFFAVVLILGSRSAARADLCQNNPGCFCYAATYMGGESCKICRACGDCVIVIC
jgi:hypothetical protein